MLAIANMNATVTLYLADGTAYPLAQTRIPASGVAVINVNQALASAPANIAKHLSTFGSATLSYNWDWQGAVMATMSSLDTTRSLQYVYPFMAPESSSMSGTMTFQGLWWKPTPASHVFVVVSNSTAAVVNAAIALQDASGASRSTQQVSVPAHGAWRNSIHPPG